MKNYGWKGSLDEFLHINKHTLVNELCLQIYEQTLEDAQLHPKEESTISQIGAWFDCIDYLKKEVPEFKDIPGFLIFEYEIIRSGRRRPDVLLFFPGEVLVLEFKRYARVDDPEYNQTSLYVRDLENYHSAIQEYDLNVRGVLVATSAPPQMKQVEKYQLYVIGQHSLNDFVQKLRRTLKDVALLTDTDFTEGRFEPLPSIIESAKAMMRDEPLPEIKSLKSSNYDHVVSEVKAIAEKAKRSGSHHLILVSGVPGAGKTFVGLTLSHELEKAVYLSGNGPLVDVLQDSLQNKAFVQALSVYKNDYLRHGTVPDNNVIIFDEAQRAWDAARMRSDKSEPDVIIDIVKHKEWSVVVGLIGEGQEIYIGEESGIGLWNEAIENQHIHVHARHHQTVFSNALTYEENHHLHLKTSLRTHSALTYFQWVEAIISGDRQQVSDIGKQLEKERYVVKEVNTLEEAKDYVRKTYEGTDKTYGIVVSSGVKFPKGVKTIPYAGRNENPKSHVAYFNYPDSRYYCRNLEYAASEFEVQGLELDMAIVYWGKDLRLDQNDKWQITNPMNGVKDEYQMKLNAYRVLLTRGRDGVVIYREK